MTRSDIRFGLYVFNFEFVTHLYSTFSAYENYQKPRTELSELLLLLLRDSHQIFAAPSKS